MATPAAGAAHSRTRFSLRAGVVDVTPSRPGPLAGYEARRGAVSTGTNDPLHATLVVLGDEAERMAWLALDAIAVPAELARRLRDAVREGLADPDVFVVAAASHTHSAPRGWVGSIHPGHSGSIESDDVDELIGKVRALAADLAKTEPESVAGTWGSGNAVGLGANRLTPGGPHDDGVGVLALRSVATGALRAIVFDAAVHPTVYGAVNLRWSADWPGAARRVVSAAARAVNESAGQDDGAAVVLFLQGAAGDVSARFTRRGADSREVARLGTIAAAAVIETIAHDGHELNGPMRRLSRVIELARRPLPSIEVAERELAQAAADHAELADMPPLDPRVRLSQSRVDGALVQRGLVAAAPDDVIRFPISVLAIGDVAWVHVPVELFTSIGGRIQSGSPFPVTRVVGYADDYLGYMVDEAAFEAGTYEALSSYFLPDAAHRLVDEVRQMMKEIR